MPHDEIAALRGNQAGRVRLADLDALAVPAELWVHLQVWCGRQWGRLR